MLAGLLTGTVSVPGRGASWQKQKASASPGGGEGEGPVTPLPATGLSLLRDFDQSERSMHFSVQDVLLAN